jgi:outer membrane lipoprotein-sorting protein
MISIAAKLLVAIALAAATPAPSGSVRGISDKDLQLIKTLDSSYQNSKAISMRVEKTLKAGLLNQVRKASGKLFLSGGRVRLELEGSEKTLLVVNKQNLWAVTYPGPEFKNAAIQVIKGDTTSKKTHSQSMVGLLSLGGFLKFFSPTGVQVNADGSQVYFLQPRAEQTDFKRAQLTVSKDGKRILQLRYWDERDNETDFLFSDVKFGAKVDDKMFNYSPPANADVMNL